jgi:serine/threonine protein phosphatase 1
MKTTIITGTEKDFFARGKEIARKLDRGERVDPAYTISYEDPPLRRFALGDIHGCSRTLRKMVEELLHLEPSDLLFLLGDYIDRGPDSKGVLDYFLQLLEAGYNILPLLGNHDEMLLHAAVDPTACSLWYGNGGWQTLKDFGVETPEEIPQSYLNFFASLPLMYLLDDYVLVHAGLDFRKTDPITESTSHDLLWAREFRIDPAKLAGRTLITGHTRTPLFEIRESLTSSHIKLDNGCYDKGEIGYGALVCLNLDTRELLVQENIELDK